MQQIRELDILEYPAFVEIASLAYPGMGVNSEEEKRQLVERLERQTADKSKKLYGCFQNDILLGGMLLHDFTMTYQAEELHVGGLGFVCVDLLYKKEKIAKSLVEYFENHYQNRKFQVTALYPFRPDFYKKMGYGYGSKMNEYRFAPSELPRGESKMKVIRLSENHASDVLACYSRYAKKTHGMMAKTVEDMKVLLRNPKIKVYGVLNNHEIKGYCAFTFASGKKDNFLCNHLVMNGFISETAEAFSELCTFLHSQQDQVKIIIWHTQDENFHFLLKDPRNGTDELMPHVYHESHKAGVGLMYKVLDIRQFFMQRNTACFGKENICIQWEVWDSFVQKNESVTIDYQNGIGTITDSKDHIVTVRLSKSEFSSLLMGAVDAMSLDRFGLIHLSDYKYLPTIQHLFTTIPKPICMTAF